MNVIDELESTRKLFRKLEAYDAVSHKARVRAKFLSTRVRSKLAKLLVKYAGTYKRLRSGYTQAEVAQAADVSQGCVSYFESGQLTKLSYSKIIRLLTVYVNLENGHGLGRSDEVRNQSGVQDLQGSGS